MKSGEMKKEDMELMKFHHSEPYRPFPGLNVKIDVYTSKDDQPPPRPWRCSWGYYDTSHSICHMRRN